MYVCTLYWLWFYCIILWVGGAVDIIMYMSLDHEVSFELIIAILIEGIDLYSIIVNNYVSYYRQKLVHVCA